MVWDKGLIILLDPLQMLTLHQEGDSLRLYLVPVLGRIWMAVCMNGAREDLP